MSPDGAERVGRQASVTAWALAALASALLVVAAVISWAELRTDEPYAPLHFANPQTVTSRTESSDGAPSTRLGDTVDVTGEKCSDEQVSIDAVTSWQPVDPAGTAITTGTSSNVRRSGCVVGQYENAIPEEVAAIVRSQHARGVAAPLWVISGAETPIREDGTEGTTEVWVTEPFAILP